jgi:hypothetical protein
MPAPQRPPPRCSPYSPSMLPPTQQAAETERRRTATLQSPPPTPHRLAQPFPQLLLPFAARLDCCSRRSRFLRSHSRSDRPLSRVPSPLAQRSQYCSPPLLLPAVLLGREKDFLRRRRRRTGRRGRRKNRRGRWYLRRRRKREERRLKLSDASSEEGRWRWRRSGRKSGRAVQ